MKIIIIADGSLKGEKVVFGSWIESLKSAQKNDGNEYVYLVSRYIFEKPFYIIESNIKFISYRRFRRNPTFIDFLPSIQLKLLLKSLNTDIIHIYGTEFSHTWKAFIAIGSLGIRNKSVISIQAVINDLANHYLDGIPSRFYLFPSLKDFLKFNSLIKEFLSFKLKAILERIYYSFFIHFIGRTHFDHKFYLKYKSNKSNYYIGFESLRSSFFQKNIIFTKPLVPKLFLSGSDTPRKGLHTILKILPSILSKYPTLTLDVIGTKPATGIMGILKNDSYQQYILYLIKRYNLEKYVNFIGFLSETDFKQFLLNSSIFLMPSSHENSPNSLLEALQLKIPVLANDVGGIKQMLSYGGGYTYNGSIELTKYITNILNNDFKMYTHKSNPFIIKPEINNKLYIEIYEKIISKIKFN